MSKTSTAVKARYIKKTYINVQARLPIELVQRFKAKCEEKGVSQAKIVRNAIESFLSDES